MERTATMTTENDWIALRERLVCVHNLVDSRKPKLAFVQNLSTSFCGDSGMERFNRYVGLAGGMIRAVTLEWGASTVIKTLDVVIREC